MDRVLMWYLSSEFTKDNHTLMSKASNPDENTGTSTALLGPLVAAAALGLVESVRLAFVQDRLAVDNLTVTLAIVAAMSSFVVTSIGAGWLMAVVLRRLEQKQNVRPEAAGWAGLAFIGLMPWVSDLAWQVAATAALAVLVCCSRWPRAGWGLAAVLLVGTASQVQWPAAQVAPTSAATGPHIVLITLDTFRADHVGVIGGYTWEVRTPHLDALSEEATLFVNGVADAPLTGPSHVGILTGQQPWELGVLTNGDQAPADASWVAERLHSAGYRTGAFVSARVLAPVVGLDQGFDHYDAHTGVLSMAMESWVVKALVDLKMFPGRPVERRGDVTVERALSWLSSEESPAFLWVHLYDAHAPYAPPAPFDTWYDASAPDAPGNPDEIAAIEAEQGGITDFIDHDLRQELANYAGEVSWTDSLVGRVLDAVPGASVVVSADHGESLTEHGYFMNHGALLYESSVRVPILVRGPGFTAGQRIDAPTPARRIAATLLQLASLSPERPTLVTPPSSEWILTLAPGQQSTFSSKNPKLRQVALRRGSTKWIIDENGQANRYDLDTDPQERSPTTDGPELDSVRQIASELLGSLNQRPSNDAELAEELRALGYIE